MAKRFALPKDLAQRITDLGSELGEWAAEAVDAWEARPERWKNSDAGIAADAWIETLADAAATLEDIDSEPDKPEADS